MRVVSEEEGGEEDGGKVGWKIEYLFFFKQKTAYEIGL